MGYVPHDNIPHAQYKLINDPPCWCTGYTDIFDINHVHDKVVWTRKRINNAVSLRRYKGFDQTLYTSLLK